MTHASNEEMLRAFGVFRVVFEPTSDDLPPYLSLLHLHHASSLGALRLIRDVVVAPDSEACSLTMLRDVNWRPHLVGAIATYYQTTEVALTQMWAAIDAGSWVTPQLAGILSLRDFDFITNATGRLANGCLLSGDPEYTIASPIERHSAQGPAGSHQRSSKSAASLLALLPPNHAVHFDSDDELQALVADDHDRSTGIATNWLRRFLEWDAQL